MKLKNKKTGDIYKIEDIDLGTNEDGIWLGITKYNSLAEFCKEWEDCEEPKGDEVVDIREILDDYARVIEEEESISYSDIA